MSRHEETAWSIVSAVAVAAGLLMALAIAFGGAWTSLRDLRGSRAPRLVHELPPLGSWARRAPPSPIIPCNGSGC
jgi:hypothetical protein